MYSITNCIPVVYRHFNLLENSIDSILSQTFLPNEIIVIISEFEETKISKDKVDFLTKKIADKKIKSVIKMFKEQQYAGINREIGYNLCSSDIIIYQDCDDYTHKQRNEIIINFINKTKCVHLLHGYTSNKEELNKKINYKNIEYYKVPKHISNINKYFCRFEKKISVTNGALALVKKKIGSFSFPNKRKSQDVKLNKKIHRKFNNTFVIRINKIYLYQNNLSSWNNYNI